MTTDRPTSVTDVSDERTMSDRSWPMARSERQGDGARAGVGTMTRPGQRRARPGGPTQAPATQAPATQAPVTQGPAGQGRPAPAQPPRAPQGPQQGQPPRGQRAAAPPATGRRPGAAPWRVPPAERVTGPQPVLPKGPGTQPAGPQALAPQPGQPQAPGSQAPAPAARGRAAQLAATRRMPFVLMLCGLLGGALICALVISTTLAAGSFQITKLQNATTDLTRQRQVLEAAVAHAQSAQVIAEKASKLGMRRPQQLLFFDLKTGKTANDGPTWSGADNAPGYAP
jgi:hypothetical protein